MRKLEGLTADLIRASHLEIFAGRFKCSALSNKDAMDVVVRDYVAFCQSAMQSMGNVCALLECVIKTIGFCPGTLTYLILWQSQAMKGVVR